MFRYFSAALVCFLCFIPIVAQDNNQPTPIINQPALLPSEIQWEYLIVKLYSLGGFEDYQGSNEPVPDLEPAQKKINVNRKFGYTSDETTFYSQLSESRKMQAALDSLGKVGWELVGVAPADSHDGNSFSLNSSLIFKRRFDAERSQRETKYFNNKQTAATASNKNNKKSIEFINLDVVEVKAAQLDVENKAAASLEQSLKNIKDIPITEIKVKGYFQPNAEPVTEARIVIDGSQTLLKEGNKYRASEAQAYLRQIATQVFNKIGLRKTDSGTDFFFNGNQLNPYGSVPRIQILISVNLSVAGESKTVAAGTLLGLRAEVAKQ